MKANTIGTLHPNNLGMIDFSDTCIRLGARTTHKPVRWTELDLEDWKILRALLTKPITEGRTAASESKSLASLAHFAEAIISWYERGERIA